MITAQTWRFHGPLSYVVFVILALAAISLVYLRLRWRNRDQNR